MSKPIHCSLKRRNSPKTGEKTPKNAIFWRGIYIRLKFRVKFRIMVRVRIKFRVKVRVRVNMVKVKG